MALVVVPVVALVALVGSSLFSRLDSASGDVSTTSGGAFGESISVRTLLGSTVSSGPMPAVVLPASGGGPFQDRLASANVAGLVSAGVLNVSTEATSGPNAAVTSSAAVANLSLIAGAVSTDLVTSMCSATATGVTASSTLGHVSAAGLAIPVDPAPNTTIDLPLVGSLILNEQVASTTAGGFGITVNAIHLKLNSAVVGTGDVVVAQARCQQSAPTVTVPVGAVGGIGLAGLLGLIFFWRVLRRRPDARASSIPVATR
jgi:hypothetical protein